MPLCEEISIGVNPLSTWPYDDHFHLHLTPTCRGVEKMGRVDIGSHFRCATTDPLHPSPWGGRPIRSQCKGDNSDDQQARKPQWEGHPDLHSEHGNGQHQR